MRAMLPASRSPFVVVQRNTNARRGVSRGGARGAVPPVEALERRALLAAAPTFSAPVVSDVGHDPSVVLADFDRDGAPDVAVADSTGTTIRIQRGDRSGRFAGPVVYSVGDDPNFPTPGDFDNDGDADLAFTHWFGDRLALMGNDGRGNFGPPRTFPAGGPNPVHAQAADFDNDGNLDLATSGWFSGGVRVHFGDGAGGFSAPDLYAAGGNTLGLVQGDFNNDRRADLAVSNTGDGTFTVFLNDGAGRFRKFNFDTEDGPNNMAVADFNNDGAQDLAIGHGMLGRLEEAVSLHFGDGSPARPRGATPSPSGRSPPPPATPTASRST